MKGRYSFHARHSSQAGFRINRHCDICLGTNDSKRNTYYPRRQNHKAEKRPTGEKHWHRYHWGSNRTQRPLLRLCGRGSDEYRASLRQRRSAQRLERAKKKEQVR